ncbi:uncharacterized protein LOC143550137 [Bidens hawaiensis]|uniref:uncharacterized protein LOC143550137 n=1 Tax=Bidens hawaiensis TaxID=980011 RepID=UPI0040491449
MAAGLLTYLTGGAGIFVFGATESIISTTQIQNPPRSKSTHSISFLLTSLISFLFILNSLISITHNLKSHDQTGVVLQLQVISIILLFLLFSVLSLLSNIINSFHIPSYILNIICLFGFIEEFFMFYLQKKDPDGIENRYYDLLLVPVSVCIVSTILELKDNKDVKLGSNYANYARFGRGVGLVMQGMWFVQMGISFYSGLMTDGCYMKEKSCGNFTVWCKGHPEFHRARAIATLHFNCHLALVVCFVVGGFSLVSKDEVMRYKPIGAEMQRVSGAQFTLDSDDDEGDNEKTVVVVPETGVNGYGSHH